VSSVSARSQPATLSESVRAVLTLLASGGGGRLVVSARSRGGVGQRSLSVGAEKGYAWIPGPLLEMLEEDMWALQVALPTADDNGSRSQRLGAFIASVDLPPIYDGSHWRFDEVGLGEAFARFEAFLPPTIVLDARVQLVGMWALAEPLDVRSADGQGVVRELGGYEGHVDCVSVEAARVYTVEDLEAAVAAAEKE
jgi:hypothetical protein